MGNRGLKTLEVKTEIPENSRGNGITKVLELHLSDDGMWMICHGWKDTSFQCDTAIRPGQPAKADKLILDQVRELMQTAVEHAAEKLQKH